MIPQGLPASFLLLGLHSGYLWKNAWGSNSCVATGAYNCFRVSRLEPRFLGLGERMETTERGQSTTVIPNGEAVTNLLPRSSACHSDRREESARPRRHSRCTRTAGSSSLSLLGMTTVRGGANSLNRGRPASTAPTRFIFRLVIPTVGRNLLFPCRHTRRGQTAEVGKTQPYLPCSSRNFSTSMAAMQPLPAAVMACR